MRNRILFTLLVLILSRGGSQLSASVLVWDVASPLTQGPPFPSADAIQLDSGVLLGGGLNPFGDPLPPVFVRTHRVELRLANVISALAVDQTRLCP